MTWLEITCGKCGHTDDFERFTSTAAGDELPNGTYQCPQCHAAWQRIPVGYKQIGDQYVADHIELRPVAAAEEVQDDVCRWRYVSFSKGWKTQCGHETSFEFWRSSWTHCPLCLKPLEVGR